MARVDAVNVQLDSAWRVAHGVAQILESGREAAPLTDRFALMGAGLWDSTLRVVLIGLTPELAARALSWISGKDHGPTLASVLARAGLTEVRLDSGGFSSLAAVAETGIDPTGPARWLNPVRLVLPCCDDVAGATLLVPGGAGALAAPGSFSAMGGGRGLVIVAGEPGSTLSEKERVVIAELTSCAAGCMAAVLTGDSAADGPLKLSGPGVGWWEDRDLLRSSALLASQRWSAAGPPAVPALFRDPSDAVRRAVVRGVQIKSLRDGCALLKEQIRERVERVERRSLVAAFRLGLLRQTAIESLRSQADELRAWVGARVADVESSWEGRALEGGRPGSPLVTSAMDLLNSESNLPLVKGQDAGSVTIRTSVALLEKMAAAISANAAESLRQDLTELRLVVERVHGEVSARLAVLAGRAVEIELPAVDTDSDGPGVLEVKTFEFRPVPDPKSDGFFGYLWRGRQSLVSLIMVLSLAGLAVGVLRLSPPLMVLAFLGVLTTSASALLTWRQLESDRRERELGRLHAGVSAEVLRIAEATQRAKLRHLVEKLERAHAAIRHQIDLAVLVLAEERAAQTSAQHQTLCESLRADEIRQKGLAALGDRIDQAQQVLNSAGDSARAELQAAVKGPPPAPPRNAYAGGY